MRLLLSMAVTAAFIAGQSLVRDPTLLALDLATVHGLPDLAARVLEGASTDVSLRARAARAIVRGRVLATAPVPDPDAIYALARELQSMAGQFQPADLNFRRVVETESAEAWRRAALTRSPETAEARSYATESYLAFDGVRTALGGLRAPRQADRALWSRATFRSAEMRLLAAPAIAPQGDRNLVREARQLFDALAVEAESDPSLGGWLPHASLGSARASHRLDDRPAALASLADLRRAVERSDPTDPATRAVLEGGTALAATLGVALGLAAERPVPTGLPLPAPPLSPRAEALQLLASGQRQAAAEVLERAAESASPEDAEPARLEALKLRAEEARTLRGPARTDALTEVARRAKALIRSRPFSHELPSDVANRALELQLVAAAAWLDAADGDGQDASRREALACLAWIPDGAPVALRVAAFSLRARIHISLGALPSAEADMKACEPLDSSGKSIAALLRVLAEREEALCAGAVDGEAQRLKAARAWRRWLTHRGTTATAAAADAVAWRLFDARAFVDALGVDEDALTRYPTATTERGRVRIRAALAREQVALQSVRDGKDPSASLKSALGHLDVASRDVDARLLLERRDVRALRARLLGGQVVESRGGMTWLAGVGVIKDAMALWEGLREDGSAPWLWEARFHLVVLSAFDDRASGRDPAAARSAFRALEGLYPDLGGRETAARFRWAESAFLR